MATYHICDLCGEDLSDKAVYYITVGPKTKIKDTPCSFRAMERNHSLNIDLSNEKEVCEDCATAYSRSLNFAEKQRDNHAKVLCIGEQDFNTGRVTSILAGF